MASIAQNRVFFHFLQPISLHNRKALKRFLLTLFKREGFKLAELHYIFCSDEYLLKINQQYLKHDFYTDIITFDLSDKATPGIRGEIYISIDRVRDNAQNFDVSFKQEIHRVIFHGALHLCGYKDKSKGDKTRMKTAEDRCVKQYFNS